MAKKKAKNKIKYRKEQKKNKKRAAISKNLASSVRHHKSKKKFQGNQIFDDVHKTKVRIIGIGGGGDSIVSEITSRVKKADFVVANTDARALKTVKKAKRFQFGKNLTQGLGTGMNVEMGEAAAQNEKERIKKLFEGQDLCIIISCLGGGTGCGATPVFAKIAKNSNCLTYGIFTLPFDFEGEKKMEVAKEALLKIKSYLNVYSIIPNERIFQIIDKNTPLKDALSAINEELAKNLEGLIEMIYLPGLINIDFADLKTILAGHGRLAYLKTIEIEEPKKEEVVEKLISNPLYPYTIKGARGILYNVVGGKALQLSEVSHISKIISGSLNKNAKIIFGIGQSQRKKSKVDLTLLATGCNIKNDILKPVSLSRKIARSSGSGVVRPKRKRKIKQETKRKRKRNKKIAGKPLIFEKNPPQNKKVQKLKPEPEIKKEPQLETKLKGKLEQKTSRLVKAFSNKPKLLKAKPAAKRSKELSLSVKIEKQASNPLEQSPPLDKLPSAKKPAISSKLYSNTNNKIRRNALDVKKAADQEEKELLEKEKIWETPAIFRKKDDK